MIIFFISLNYNGYLRNDAVLKFPLNNYPYYRNLMELKLVISEKDENTLLYLDLRNNMLGFFSVMNSSTEYFFSESIKRAFIRLFKREYTLTIGKQYINLGLPVLFNPFEIDKSIVFTDFYYTKEGIFGFSSEVMVNPESGFKFFLKPEYFIKNSDAGFDLYTNISSFDIGLVVIRDKTNISGGIYLKGDLIIGINTSNRIYYNKLDKSYNFESLSGFDYSFFEGKLFFGTSFYYNKNENYFGLKSNKYLYNFITYNQNEFLNYSFNTITNFDDLSTLFISSITYNIFEKTTASVLSIIPSGYGEFSYDKFGEFLIILRIERRF
uniref:Uncharacterized protein n=1 Tax=candidate division WOR-3 bacterium TaxID=2052148 RepID=A0A7C4YIZ4_UNCW3